MGIKARVIDAVRRELAKRGFAVVYRTDNDLPSSFWALHERCHTESMTGPERLFALYDAVRYLSRGQVEGDIVECGVWRGGSAMMAALTLNELGDRERNLYLYDTFEGMPQPTAADVDINGVSAQARWSEDWCAVSLDVVRANLASTGYPMDRINFVPGKVEDTIPATSPDRIALLRLDTDFYESTAHELEHLYPRLQPGGVLIIDDYGNWEGARKAVDEYFADDAILLNRIDYTGRIAVKPALAAAL
jgi:O-methyltransferase